MNLYASSLELWRASWCSASEKVRLSHERRDNNRINLQPLGWFREGDFIGYKFTLLWNQ
jgi:hypothetical protein